MHISGATRIRVLIVFVLLLIIWQIMKYWNELTKVNHELMLKTIESPVVVGVFYEALCPDSKHFVIKQVQASYKKAPYLMTIDFYPYGKAKTITNPDGSLRFTCQHGKVECEANLIHACTIEVITEPEARLNAISCMIKDNMEPLNALKKCVDGGSELEQILKCSNSPHGSELLKVHGEATQALRPEMTFVPTVTLDGIQNHQAYILKDLFAEVCKVISGRGPPPPICGK